MFPRSHRLQRSQDILTVFRTGERFRRGPLTIFYCKGTEPRVTVVVDKKVSKKATDRNRLKRQLRALLMQEALPAGDMVLRVYSGAEHLQFSELKTTLEACLRALTTQSRP